MKHLIALSLKYIRRQKLRTILTFMCITLSAFILATVCAYGSSIFTTLLNYEIDEGGTWELDVENWIEHTPDPEKAMETVKGHPSVDDYCYYNSEFISFDSESLGASFFEISDGKTSHRIKNAAITTCDGNAELISHYETDGAFSMNKSEGIYVSRIFEDMGYKEGDTVTFTIRPANGKYDESSQIMKEVRSDLKEKYGTEYTIYDEEYEELSEELKSKASKAKIGNLLAYNKGIYLDDTPIVDITYGEPVEYTIKIAGFTDVLRSMEKFIDILNTSSEKLSFAEISEKNPDIIYEGDDIKEMYIRITDNIDFDDAVKKLFTDLGFDYDRDFYNKEEFGVPSNTMLLALEWKSSDAISSIIPSFVVPGLLILLIAWFIARFVIDNAFEMAVQERSTHFAALRVMGASKLQIATVVMAEAIFYIFTAIPLGIITALLICRSSINSFKNIGFPMFEFSAKPAFIGLAIFLCLIAVLISAYTSAMWAARKLSPAEALNFGKPKRGKKKHKKTKSKLDLNSKKFLRRYTRKNIGAAKSRFIVSTITMGLGVLMFTFSSLIAINTYREMKDINNDEVYDFWIDEFYSSDPQNAVNEIKNAFSDKTVFEKVNIEINCLKGFKYSDDMDSSLISGTRPDADENTRTTMLQSIDRNEYEAVKLSELTGMSYDELVASKSVFRNVHDKDSREFTAVEKETTIEFVGTDTPMKYIGTTRSKLEKGYSGAIIIPVENTPALNTYYFIKLKASPQHYDAAKKIVDEFSSKHNIYMTMDNYFAGTGLNSFINAIVKIVLAFLISIWLVGILSMVNSVNTSVLNRSRELMMLRSVGMTRKQLRKSVLMETIMFSATAAIVGTILGVLIFIPVWSDKLSNVIAPVIIVVILSMVFNIIIAVLSAIPATKSLEKVESIAQAVNR